MWRRTSERSCGSGGRGRNAAAAVRLGRGSAVAAAVVVAALVAMGPGPASADCHVPSFTYKHAVVTFTEAGRSAQVRVEIADTPESLEIGLMCRTSLNPDAGMLFAFPDTTQAAFWMKNTLVPLSIAFIDATWHIAALMDMQVAPDPEKGPFETYTPSRPYRYALEVNLGFFKQHDIDEHAEVHFLPQEGWAGGGGHRADLGRFLPAR